MGCCGRAYGWSVGYALPVGAGAGLGMYACCTALAEVAGRRIVVILEIELQLRELDGECHVVKAVQAQTRGAW